MADGAKLLLCFLILFNASSEKGADVGSNVASGTIISISTSKGSVIVTRDGDEVDNAPAAPSGNTNRRWNHYETALSNTGPLGQPDFLPSTSTVAPPTTTAGTTVVATESPAAEAAAAETLPVTGTTRKPSIGGRGLNRTSHHSNSHNSNILNSARKYIASYEDLQARFPDGSPFENNTSINMTVPLGDTAFLRCRVRNLGERSISWIRRRDWHILTTGKTTYTNDERFNVLHVDGTEDWTLQIKFVQKRDNGTYECQVSTGTGIISYFVNLFIAVPEAFILGNGEYHVEQGSNINLVCVIEKSPKPPEYIFWYHNERMINYGNSREVVVRTEPGARTHSRLTIRDARISDSGNYTCKTAHAEPASIFVYVSQASGLFSGDKMAAIQRRKTSGTSSISSSGDSTLPEAASSAPAVQTALTAAHVVAAVAASLTISSIQLSSAINLLGCWGAGTTGNPSQHHSSCLHRHHHSTNFLLSLVIFAVAGDVAVTTLQICSSPLLLPALVVLAGGRQITHFVVARVSPSFLSQGFHHHNYNRRDYCHSFTNNPEPGLQNSVDHSHRHHHSELHQLLLEEQREKQGQEPYPSSSWWLEKPRYFVTGLRGLYQRLSSSSSSMDKSLPVFLSIAQSLWTRFSSGFSRFLKTSSGASRSRGSGRGGGYSWNVLSPRAITPFVRRTSKANQYSL